MAFAYSNNEFYLVIVNIDHMDFRRIQAMFGNVLYTQLDFYMYISNEHKKSNVIA